MLQDKDQDGEIKNANLIVFSKTNQETDALIAQTTYTSNDPIQEEHTASGTTTQGEILEMLNNSKNYPEY